MIKPKIIAITGGSGSGKTTAAKMLQNLLGPENCPIISQDSYYKDQSHLFHGDGSVNFDHPQAIDFELMTKHVQELINGNPINVPIYDFVTHTRKKETLNLTLTKFIIVDGILILHEPKLRELFSSILFLDIPEPIRFSRRLKRDVEQRGRTPEGVKIQFDTLVKPMHDLYVAPLNKYANYIAKTDEEVAQCILKLHQELSR